MASQLAKIERELGRKKLMMKLPVLRDQLRDAAGVDIEKLFVAYERTNVARDKVRALKGGPWLTDFSPAFEELEDCVRQYFAALKWNDFP